MLAKGIKKVCIIGAGTMGMQIALQSARAGYSVALFDVSEKIIEEVQVRYRQMVEFAKQMGVADIPDDSKALNELILTTNATLAAKDADIISESVPENLELKRKVHSHFEGICPTRTIITTNTSSLSVSDIAVALNHPERFAAMHFHSGLGPLVDIMCGEKTAALMVSKLEEFVRSIGLIPMVMRNETPGYLYNNMLMAVNMTALRLVVLGAGTPQDIDRAWMIMTGNSYGPFGIIDAVGINVAYDIAISLKNVEEKDRIIAFLQGYIDKNELGLKTNKGFYVYPEPAYRKPDFIAGGNE